MLPITGAENHQFRPGRPAASAPQTSGRTRNHALLNELHLDDGAKEVLGGAFDE